jgi:hypothetical protein
MPDKPKFDISRDGTNVTAVFHNRENRMIAAYRSRFENEELEYIGDTELDETVFQVNPEWRAAFQFRFYSLLASLNFLEDNTDQSPAYYVVEPIPPTTFSDLFDVEYEMKWAPSPATVKYTSVDNLRQGAKSIRKYTKS